ncbi:MULTISPECIES: DedA family protein [Peribacillus]|uniref:DedA family protein n=1 Tax=Peribacillus TaxID=2675229 RepID=UPI0020404BD8|nr:MULTISPECIES: DedA family protein [Peribacillus]MCM3673784.1 DedA family protein [Peribacillus simplex]MDQ0882165.1 membrane protein DedA with SNARE-associated domain [Peribacillus sp. V2I11]
MENHVAYLLEHYGYLGIIVGLIGGIVGIPIPDEVLLTYIGYNVFQGELSYLISIVSAFVGATGGISLSYFIGYKFGLPLLEKFGPKLHITEPKIIKTKKLFKKFGPYLLLFGYFIPGVRHLTAYIAAVNRFPFRKFVVYAYTGALIWIFTFITLGRILGGNWNKVELYMSTYCIYLITSLLILSILIYFLWKRRNRLRRGIS